MTIEKGKDMQIMYEHHTDKDGNPAGGEVRFDSGPESDNWFSHVLPWQDGLPNEVGRTGLFVEEVITATIDRMNFYELSKFSCQENREAIGHLNAALMWLRKRTARREGQGVEGTHHDDRTLLLSRDEYGKAPSAEIERATRIVVVEGDGSTTVVKDREH